MSERTRRQRLVIQKLVENVSRCDGPPIPPHPNVIFTKHHGRCIFSEERGEEYSTVFDIHLPLAIFIDSNGKENVVKVVLLQLAHGVEHIHKNGLSHGNIRLDMMYLSKTRETVVLSHSGEVRQDRKATASEKTKDIRDLGKVFDEILKMNSSGKIQGSNSNVAQDLLNVMQSDQATTADVLLHPYFWDSEKKLNFISRIVQFSKAGNVGKPIKDALNQRSKEVFGAGGWKNALEISCQEELDEYNRNRKARAGKKKNVRLVRRLVIKNYSDEKNQKRGELLYNEHELQSLLNFIRNRWEHFWEDGLDVQACFGYDHSNGFWKFFSRRFGKLLMVIHKVAQKQIDERNEPGITDTYFKSITENRNLTKLEEHGKEDAQMHVD